MVPKSDQVVIIHGLFLLALEELKTIPEEKAP